MASFQDTIVVNMRTSAYDVAIDRTSIFGNPYYLGEDGDRQAVLSKYREYFHERVARDEAFKRKVLALRGKRLGCHCAGDGKNPSRPCHGMIIVEWLETIGAGLSEAIQ